ncbi:hypothetical protein L596_030406 [Steinernema carpocapsae]|uniref:Uncharacterized protein n=1 Tax=Steinernema carpocapsae TaxID=34508 RepID=A0A4U5LPA7_STECR|nr:hypothetical protein L596_030406 [Steinernema carpocapsae]
MHTHNSHSEWACPEEPHLRPSLPSSGPFGVMFSRLVTFGFVVFLLHFAAISAQFGGFPYPNQLGFGNPNLYGFARDTYDGNALGRIWLSCGSFNCGRGRR